MHSSTTSLLAIASLLLATPTSAGGLNECSPTGQESCNFRLVGSAITPYWHAAIFDYTCRKIGYYFPMSASQTAATIMSELKYTVELRLDGPDHKARPLGGFWYAGVYTPFVGAACADCADQVGVQGAWCCRVAFNCAAQ